MDGTTIMAIFSALALGHSLFLAGYFWAPVHKSPGRFFLALLLTALAVRIMKSVLVILLPGSPEIIPAIGLIGLSAIGPSLYMYVQSFKNIHFRFIKQHLWHFALSAFILFLLPFVNESQMYILYCASVLQMLVYIILAATSIYGKGAHYYKFTELKWLQLLISGISIIWITFLAQLLIERFVTYLMVTIVASIVIYGLSIWAKKKYKLFTDPKRNFQDNDLKEIHRIGSLIEKLFERPEFYTDPEASVKKVAQATGHPDYLVSRTINIYFKKTFPELLNEYRIEYAATLICSASYDHLSIEGIAYESGYNSISAFYRAFKHIKGMTPLHFKESVIRSA